MFLKFVICGINETNAGFDTIVLPAYYIDYCLRFAPGFMMPPKAELFLLTLALLLLRLAQATTCQGGHCTGDNCLEIIQKKIVALYSKSIDSGIGREGIWGPIFSYASSHF